MWKEDYGQLLQQNQEMKARLRTTPTPTATAPPLTHRSYQETSQQQRNDYARIEEMEKLKKMVNNISFYLSLVSTVVLFKVSF